MKKRVFLTAILSLVMCSNSIYAFDGPTHTYVTAKALEIFEKAHGTKYSEIFTPRNKAIILEYCVMPDKDETDDAYSQHFFNLATQKNFKGTEDSALTKLCTHFYRAVGFYQASNVEMAMQELGRALHFEEDLSTPVHSNTVSALDAGTKFLSHVGFENKCKELQEHFVAEMAPPEFGYYDDNSIRQIGLNSSDMASQNYAALNQHKRSHVHKEQLLTEIVGNSVIQAQKNAAGVLYRFCLKVLEEKS